MKHRFAPWVFLVAAAAQRCSFPDVRLSSRESPIIRTFTTAFPRANNSWLQMGKSRLACREGCLAGLGVAGPESGRGDARHDDRDLDLYPLHHCLSATVTVTAMDIPTVTEDLGSAVSLSLRTVIMAVHSPLSAILSTIRFIIPTFRRAFPIHIDRHFCERAGRFIPISGRTYRY